MIANDLRILYQDEQILLVHKMPKIHVHPSRLSIGEVSLQDLLHQTGYDFAQCVHRLDRPSSGPVIFALRPELVAPLTLQFEQNLVRKTYLALVRGWLEKKTVAESPIDDQLGGLAKAAITHLEPTSRFLIDREIGLWKHMRLSQVRAQPQTGRRHQIRRHLKRMGHPIIGDFAHGDRHYNHSMMELLGACRLQLACVELAFIHPTTGAQIDVYDPIEHHEAWILNNPSFRKLMLS